jgi:hypothetical protein
MAADAITRAQAVDDLKGQGEPVDLSHVSSTLLAAMPDRVFPMQVEALLSLTGRNLSAAQKESIEDDVRTAILNYVNGLPMGSDLIFNKLLGLIVQPDQIADASLLIGGEASGKNESFKGNLSTEGRKAKIDIQRIFVGLMDEIVTVDVVVQLEANPAVKTPGTPQVDDALKAAITNAINQKLSGNRNITRTDITNAIRQVVTARVPQQLQLIAGNAVSLNATFQESGRLLNNTDTLALADNESPVLGQLSVNVTGPQNG